MPDSFQRPVDPSDPFGKFQAEQIEKDKMTPNEEPPKRSLWALLAAYMSLMVKKMLDLFEQTSEHGLAENAERDLREDLILFKAVLELLKKEDHSQDASFLHRLSELWHQLLEDLLCFRKQTPLSDQLNRFIKELQNYPDQQEHSLGYYLTDAGREWLPIPFMEMIHRLHVQHHKNPPGSLLSRWTSLLSALISQLPPKIEQE